MRNRPLASCSCGTLGEHPRRRRQQWRTRISGSPVYLVGIMFAPCIPTRRTNVPAGPAVRAAISRPVIGFYEIKNRKHPAMDRKDIL